MMTRWATTSKPGQPDQARQTHAGRDAHAVAPAEMVAWRSAAAVITFLAVTLGATVADLWSKHAVFASLLSEPHVEEQARAIAAHGDATDPREVLKALELHREVGWGLRLALSTNPGVVFGLPMPPALVAVATVLTIIMVSWFFGASAAKARWTHVALGLILAGALGNFYDRMLARVAIPGIDAPITGQVRDFIDFSQLNIMGVNYPYIFNVADVWLVVGVVMLMLYWLFAGRTDKKQAKKV